MTLSDRVAALFGKVFGLKPADFTPDLAPEDVPQWDSVGHMTLVADMESAFGVRFDVDELTEMSSGGKIIELLRAKGVND
jgi:acyl carrier protein